MSRPHRVSDADRERVVDLLRVRCAEGYLSPDTLSRRVESSLRARTTMQLEALVSDLPRRMEDHARTAWRRVAGALTEAWMPAHGDTGLLVVSARQVQRNSGRVVLGRSKDSDIRLADASVSRRHAELRHTHGRWWIEDLGSLNGVLVNGRRVVLTELDPGDHIGLGDLILAFEPGR